MGDLTANFSLDEFLVSERASRMGIANTPDAEHLKRIRTVVAPGMQIIRDAVARSIVITSGYRNPTVNRLVGGVPNSDHAQAWAVDSRAAGISAYTYACLIAALMKPGGKLFNRVDQLILESSRNIVHVSFAPQLRGQILTQRKGPGTPVEKGLLA